jgi:hypothetical protein
MRTFWTIVNVGSYVYLLRVVVLMKIEIDLIMKLWKCDVLVIKYDVNDY